jgi:uncharacterized protein (DUF1697 family)
MIIYISMLRGINVGGHKKVKMVELKSLYESLGFNDVKTYIQSGNIIFKTNNKCDSSSELIKKIELTIKEVYGFEVHVFIRSISELERIINNNPFIELDTSKLHITFLSDHPTNIHIKEINKVKNETEKYFFSDKEIYLFLPKGYGRTKLSNDFFEKKLSVNATTRNWRTINNLLNIAKSLSK